MCQLPQTFQHGGPSNAKGNPLHMWQCPRGLSGYEKPMYLSDHSRGALKWVKNMQRVFWGSRLDTDPPRKCGPQEFMLFNQFFRTVGCGRVSFRTLSRAASVLGFCCFMASMQANAAGLTADAKAAVPHDVQQIIVVDYRAMQNSPAAMSLKDRVLPPELKRLESALMKSGLNVDQDTEALAFASFRLPNPEGKGPQQERTVGIAQGQFHTRDIMANFTKNKSKPVMVRNNSIYPMGSTGLMVRVFESGHDALRR